MPGVSTYCAVQFCGATSDFNGDGKVDVVTADYSSNAVSVLLNNGNGTFGVASVYSVGRRPQVVAAADLNGDGKVDIVTGDQGTKTVSVLLGNGNGTFGTKSSYGGGGPGTTTEFVTLGDVNGDGKIDIVATNANGNTVSVLLGNGNGTFGTASVFGVGALYPYDVAVADFNGDGKADIVTEDVFSNAVSVLLNTTSGGNLSLSEILCVRHNMSKVKERSMYATQEEGGCSSDRGGAAADTVGLA